MTTIGNANKKQILRAAAPLVLKDRNAAVLPKQADAVGLNPKKEYKYLLRKMKQAVKTPAKKTAKAGSSRTDRALLRAGAAINN